MTQPALTNKKPERYYIVFTLANPTKKDLEQLKENKVIPERLEFLSKATICIHNVEDETMAQWICSTMTDPETRWLYTAQGPTLHVWEANGCPQCTPIVTQKIAEKASAKGGKTVEIGQIKTATSDGTSSYVELKPTDKPFSPKILEDGNFFTN